MNTKWFWIFKSLQSCIPKVCFDNDKDIIHDNDGNDDDGSVDDDDDNNYEGGDDDIFCCLLFLIEELLELHRGQGMDIYWRDSYTCPTEDEYKEMVQRSKCVLPLNGIICRQHRSTSWKLVYFEVALVSQSKKKKKKKNNNNNNTFPTILVFQNAVISGNTCSQFTSLHRWLEPSMTSCKSPRKVAADAEHCFQAQTRKEIFEKADQQNHFKNDLKEQEIN